VYLLEVIIIFLLLYIFTHGLRQTTHHQIRVDCAHNPRLSCVLYSSIYNILMMYF